MFEVQSLKRKNVQRSVFKVQRSKFYVQRSMFNVQSSRFETKNCSRFNVQRSKFSFIPLVSITGKIKTEGIGKLTAIVIFEPFYVILFQVFTILNFDNLHWNLSCILKAVQD